MAICPHCDGDISDWAQRLEQAPAANTPKVWTCPECETILGISDWGTTEQDKEAQQPTQ
jgi:uncharacterized protein with PIN domain